MAKKGFSAHTKRISLGRNLPVKQRKATTFITTSVPGPHARTLSVPLSNLLREQISLCTDLKEVKKVLNQKMVLVDGKPITDYKRPVGLLDIISIPKMQKSYRMQIINGHLCAKEISEPQSLIKYCKVVSKKTAPKAKIVLTLHDGRNLIADNNVKVGSTLKMSIPQFKLQTQIEFVEGAKCYVVSGKHAGKFATLKKITQSLGSMPSSAELEDAQGGFVTLAKYLFAVDDEFVK